MTTPPRAQGQRLDWAHLTETIRGRIEAALGEPVVSAETAAGGFSPGMAAVLTLASGRQVFAKAVSNGLNDVAPQFHRREMLVASLLPEDAPVPKLLWSWAEDGGDEWAVLVYERMAGRLPAQPWVAGEFAQVVEALNALSASLTPSPVTAEAIGATEGGNPIRGGNWLAFREEGLSHADAWVARNLDRLIAREAQVAQITPGNTLLHMDLRGDNMLLTDSGVVIVDWPHAQIGPAWLDGAFFAPSVAMEGGPEPEALVQLLDAMRESDPDELTTGVVELAGFFTTHGARPPVPGLPGLRAFQEAQGAVARRWVAQRTGWA